MVSNKLLLMNRYSRLACRKKKHFRLATQVCFGQNWLKNNLSRCDHTSAPLGSTRETAKHFISECPAYTMVRTCTFRVPYISLSYILSKFGPEKLVQYIHKTGRTKSDCFPL